MLTFRFSVEEVHSKPLSRLCSESVRIHNDTCEIPMNSKAEWNQPVVARVVASRELEKLEVQGAGGGRARGRSIRLSLVGQSESVLKISVAERSLSARKA